MINDNYSYRPVVLIIADHASFNPLHSGERAETSQGLKTSAAAPVGDQLPPVAEPTSSVESASVESALGGPGKVNTP